MVTLFAIGIVAPRRSVRAQSWVEALLERMKGIALRKAPDPVERLVEKPLDKSQEATDKSAKAGRRARFRLPF